MNYKKFAQFLCCSALIFFGCSKEDQMSPEVTSTNQEASVSKNSLAGKSGATQISGLSFFDDGTSCDAVGNGATFALEMTGDLEGCFYVWVDSFNCSPSGTYRESGHELFVGTYNGEAGTFETSYKFEAKYEGCAPDGSYLGAEILGRCQHPIVKNSGTGVFAGVKGRLDIKDDIEAGNFPYRGHLLYQ